MWKKRERKELKKQKNIVIYEFSCFFSLYVCVLQQSPNICLREKNEYTIHLKKMERNEMKWNEILGKFKYLQRKKTETN